MEIKKGDKFLCTRSTYPNAVPHTNGNIYNSDKDGYIIDDNGDSNKWNETKVPNFFKKVGIGKPNVFVYYRGDDKRGCEIVKALEELGGVNEHHLKCRQDDSLYFINPIRQIEALDYEFITDWFKSNYTEAFLPEKEEKPKLKLDPFDNVLSRYNSEKIWLPNILYILLDDDGTLDEKFQVIPYNEETKHLAYTNFDCPDKYK